MAVHVDVLTQTAAKLCAVVEAGRGPTAQGMAEYVYPAQRAREFMSQFSGYSTRASYQKFSALVDRYEAMVRQVDAARAQGADWRAQLPQLTSQRDALQRLGAEIRDDLKAGR
jgi:hypothetical protein